VKVNISCFSHTTVVNQYQSSESILGCFYNMFLPLLGNHQVKTRVHCSQTTLANVSSRLILGYKESYTNKV
jgi:hypothetical protein